jgi:hypothetical protein
MRCQWLLVVGTVSCVTAPSYRPTADVLRERVAWNRDCDAATIRVSTAAPRYSVDGCGDRLRYVCNAAYVQVGRDDLLECVPAASPEAAEVAARAVVEIPAPYAPAPHYMPPAQPIGSGDPMKGLVPPGTFNTYTGTTQHSYTDQFTRPYTPPPSFPH